MPYHHASMSRWYKQLLHLQISPCLSCDLLPQESQDISHRTPHRGLTSEQFLPLHPLLLHEPYVPPAIRTQKNEGMDVLSSPSEQPNTTGYIPLVNLYRNVRYWQNAHRIKSLKLVLHKDAPAKSHHRPVSPMQPPVQILLHDLSLAATDSLE